MASQFEYSWFESEHGRDASGGGAGLVQSLLGKLGYEFVAADVLRNEREEIDSAVLHARCVEAVQRLNPKLPAQAASWVVDAFVCQLDPNTERSDEAVRATPGMTKQWLTRLREWTRVPIIVISARGHEEDKVQALDAGADDYLTKPFGINELLARMRVAIRHAEQAGFSSEARVLEFGALTLDLKARRVLVEGREVHLTPIEYKLLVLLAQNAGRVLTHRQILKEVWGPAYANQTHYVRVRMAELRKKIEVDPARPKLLHTEPGVGYRLRAEGN